MIKVKFYKSFSGAKKFSDLKKGKIFKKGTAGFSNCLRISEELGIEVTGDYVVRYADFVEENQTDGTIFDPLYENKSKAKKKEVEKVEENQKKGRGGKREGAGRKGIQDGAERKKRGLYCSVAEFEACKRLIAEMRSKN